MRYADVSSSMMQARNAQPGGHHIHLFSPLIWEHRTLGWRHLASCDAGVCSVRHLWLRGSEWSMKTKNVRRDFFFLFLFSRSSSQWRNYYGHFSIWRNVRDKQGRNQFLKIFHQLSRLLLSQLCGSWAPPLSTRRRGHNPSPPLLWPPGSCKPDHWL